MAYSKQGVLNLALRKIGMKGITLGSGTPADLLATDFYDYVLDEVLEARDWRFAKVRKELTLRDEEPLYGWEYEYDLPSDFLRLCLENNNDPPFSPVGYPWIVESINDPDAALWVTLTNYVVGDIVYTGTSPAYSYYTCIVAHAAGVFAVDLAAAKWELRGFKILLTNYEATEDTPLYINYIQRVTNPLRWNAAFVNAAAFRFAAEFAISLTEQAAKYDRMMGLYEKALNAAEEINRSYDSSITSFSWVEAGRY